MHSAHVCSHVTCLCVLQVVERRGIGRMWGVFGFSFFPLFSKVVVKFLGDRLPTAKPPFHGWIAPHILCVSVGQSIWRDQWRWNVSFVGQISVLKPMAPVASATTQVVMALLQYRTRKGYIHQYKVEIIYHSASLT